MDYSDLSSSDDDGDLKYYDGKPSGIPRLSNADRNIGREEFEPSPISQLGKTELDNEESPGSSKKGKVAPRSKPQGSKKGSEGKFSAPSSSLLEISKGSGPGTKSTLLSSHPFSAGSRQARREPKKETKSPVITSGLNIENLDDLAAVSKFADENFELRKKIAEKNSEVDGLAEAVLSLQADLNASKSQGGAEAYKDLSRKNRELQRLLAKEKFQTASFAQEIKQLQTTQEESDEALSQAGNVTEAAASEEETWKRRCQTEISRSSKLTSQLSGAQKECTRMRAALVREIGDDLSIEKALTEGSGWKGRAESIVLLKKRLKDAQNQLALVSSSGNRDESSQQELGREGVVVGSTGGRILTPAAPSSNYAVAGAGIRKVDNQLLQKELEELRGQNISMKEKQHASKARQGVLEKEVQSLREKVAVLFNKSDSDDKLIASLRESLEAVQLHQKSELGIDAEQRAMELRSLRLFKFDAERRIHTQEVQINGLLRDVEKLKEIRSVFVKNVVKEWTLEEAKRSEQMLLVEIGDLKAMRAAAEERVEAVTSALSSQTQQAAMAQARLQTLERRLASRGGLGTGGSGASIGTESKLSTREQLEVLSAEKILAGSSYSDALHRKELEISHLTKRFQEEQIYHAKSIESLQKKLDFIQKSVAFTGYVGVAAPNSQNSADINSEGKSPINAGDIGRPERSKGSGDRSCLSPREPAVSEGNHVHDVVRVESKRPSKLLDSAKDPSSSGIHKVVTEETKTKRKIEARNVSSGNFDNKRNTGKSSHSSEVNDNSRRQDGSGEMLKQANKSTSENSQTASLPVAQNVTDPDVSRILAHLLSQDF